MDRNVKQRGLAVVAAIMVVGVAFFVCPSSASALEGAATQQAVQPIFESEKGWTFQGDNLYFFNPSPNPDGTRFVRWKEYTWVVTAERIVVIDPRPYGTQVQGLRSQMTAKGRQSDKDLMKSLKEEAEDIREAKDPNHPKGLPINLNVGLGFRF